MNGISQSRTEVKQDFLELLNIAVKSVFTNPISKAETFRYYGQIHGMAGDTKIRVQLYHFVPKAKLPQLTLIFCVKYSIAILCPVCEDKRIKILAKLIYSFQSISASATKKFQKV